MDFLSKFDARTAAETPRPYHLRHQHDGSPIMDGDTPCIVLIKGAASRSAQAAIRAEEQERMKALKGAKTKEDQAQALEDLHQTLCKAAARFIAGFEGMQTTSDDGKPRPMDSRDVAKFLDLNFISMAHLLKAQNAPVRQPDEADEAFDARKAAHEAEWTRPSFAQQILDAAQKDEDFLASAGRT